MEGNGPSKTTDASRPGLPARLAGHLRSEGEIWIILAFLAFWWGSTLDGALWVDESIYVSSASSILDGDPYTNLEHPPLGKYLIAIGISALGETSFGSRFVPMLFALMTVFVTYRLGRMLGNRGTAALAAILLGITPAFNAHAGQAMLDIFLTFFVVTLLYASLLVIRERGSLGDATKVESTVLAILSACAVMSKLYGVFFVVIVYLVILNTGKGREVDEQGSTLNWRDFNFLPRTQNGKHFLGITLAASAILYLPYLLRPHETIPYLVGFNAGHMAVGHTTYIAGTFYRYPPVWTYLYWISWEGIIFIVGTLVVFFWLVSQVRRGTISDVDRFLLVYTYLPLLIFSLMTVKFARYLLPLWPLIVVISTVYLYKLLVRAIERFWKDPGRGFDARTTTVLATTAIALLLVAIPSPLRDTFDNTHIGRDSGYDEVAEVLIEIHELNASRDLTVLSHGRTLLKYYLDLMDAPEGFTLVSLSFESDEVLQDLRAGKFDLVVDMLEQPRFDQTETFEYIRTESRGQIDLDGDIIIFILGDIEYER